MNVYDVRMCECITLCINVRVSAGVTGYVWMCTRLTVTCVCMRISFISLLLCVRCAYFRLNINHRWQAEDPPLAYKRKKQMSQSCACALTFCSSVHPTSYKHSLSPSPHAVLLSRHLAVSRYPPRLCPPIRLDCTSAHNALLQNQMQDSTHSTLNLPMLQQINPFCFQLG